MIKGKINDVLDVKQVIELTGIPRSSLYNLMENNNFPKPKKLGVRMARWSKQEILKWYKDKGFEIKPEKI